MQRVYVEWTDSTENLGRGAAWLSCRHCVRAHSLCVSLGGAGEAYEVACTRYGRESDVPVLFFKVNFCSQHTVLSLGIIAWWLSRASLQAGPRLHH